MIIILIPFLVALVANIITWISTREKVEVTFKLEGWITIGSVKFGDLEDLKLMLGTQPVENILKLTWRVTNSGKKGISSFESGPFIEFPAGSEVVSAYVTDPSPLLKIAKKVTLEDSRIKLDSLGIFNSNDFFKVNVYIKNIKDEKITPDYFEEWNFKGKALDLNIVKDISTMRAEAQKSKPLSDIVEAFIVTAILLALFMFTPELYSVIKHKFKKSLRK